MSEALAIIGLVAAIVQLVDFSTKIVARLEDFLSKSQEAPTALRDICVQLPLVANDLRQTKTQVEARVLTQERRNAVLAVIKACQAHLKDLDDILQKILPSSLDSPWRAGKKALLSFQQDEKLRSISEKIRNNIIYLTHHTVIARAGEDLNSSLRLQENERFRMLEWLSSVDPSANHNRALQQREPDTGFWFLHSREYERWKAAPQSLAWLYGIPGCGKTVLCSTIIEDLQEYSHISTASVVAYYYFDFNDTADVNVNGLLRSLIKQICACETELPQVVQRLCSQHKASGHQPSLKLLISVLRDIICALQQECYIVVDALDEYPEARRHDLLRTLRQLKSLDCKNIHILATSRKEQDISDALNTLSTESIRIQSSLICDDIRLHIQSCLADDVRLKRLPDTLKDDIKSQLCEKAQGMFRWVVCQLDVLRTCKRPSAIEAALKDLPRTLDETYQRILQKIEPDDFEDARAILKWVAFAERPLTLEEVAEAAVVRDNHVLLEHEDKLLDLTDVLHICRGLLSISTESIIICKTLHSRQVVRFAHFSVKEYLISKRIVDGSAAFFAISAELAQSQIAQCCLSVLLENGQQGADQPDARALLRYSAEYWFLHVRKSSVSGRLEKPLLDLMKFFFGGSDTTLRNWISLYDPNLKKGSVQTHRLGPQPLLSPLYYASLLEFIEVARFLLENGVDINSYDEIYGSALAAAAKNGSLPMVRLLLNRGADVNGFGGVVHRRALQAASSHGHEAIVRLLLQNGAMVNETISDADTALQAACERGHENIVKLLFEFGANVNAKGGVYGTALQAAAERGYHTVVELLLAGGADVNAQGGQFGYALQAAAVGGHASIVRLLLDAGADIDAQGGGFRDTLTAASIRNHENLVRLLLERGAAVQPMIGRLIPDSGIMMPDDETLSRAVTAAASSRDPSLPKLLRMVAVRIVRLNSERLEAQRIYPLRPPQLKILLLREIVRAKMNEEMNKSNSVETKGS